MEFHKQYNLRTPDELQKNKPVPDFELTQANILKTAKNLEIKNVFGVNDVELAFKKGQRFSRIAVHGATYSIATTDYLVAVDDLILAPTISLPNPSLVGVGKTFKVKDEIGGAATTTITVQVEGEKNIDGASTSTLTTDYQTKTFYTDGANYFTC